MYGPACKEKKTVNEKCYSEDSELDDENSESENQNPESEIQNFESVNQFRLGKSKIKI